ncbi:hypothetical protein QL898_12810 [Psychrobacter sp. APC 3279]|uniref:hypothetical protein n=1 Tax=Psychrobacter sp. APC 3279 TaxID=3035189 RepID=UPI0025B3ED12|nr:hypothetical protein [Psychrobacter sp. APC 3279]MDN3442512.1 hypothetical protein [Psychrobacter sp. APC 3279]
MRKNLFNHSVLLIMLPLLASCTTIDHQASIQQISEPFFTYHLPKSTSEKPVIVTPTAITTEFKYENGCLLAFDGTRWMTPVFPEGHATFDISNKTLELLGISYQMGEVVFAGGNISNYDRDKAKTYSNTLAEKCITEYLAKFYGDYEKIYLDRD